MKVIRSRSVFSRLGIGGLVLAVLPLQVLEADARQRPWQPQDSVEVRYVSRAPDAPTTWGVARETDPVITPSPDGRYFFFLTVRGELHSDSTRVDLQVYAKDAVKEWLTAGPGRREGSPSPYRSVVKRSFSSKGEQPAILGARWAPDSNAILFLAITEAGELQAHRLDLRTGVVMQLTSHSGGIASFWTRAGALLYQIKIVEPYVPQYPMTVLERQSDASLVPPLPTTRTRTYVIHRQGKPPRALSGDSEGIRYDERWISPDGRFAVGLYEGANYDLPGHRARTLGTMPQFVLVDLDTARVKVLGLQTGDYIPHTRYFVTANVFWSADSRRFVLLNVRRTDESREPRLTDEHYLGVYEAESGAWHALQPMFEPLPADATAKTLPSKYVKAADWLREHHELLVTHHVEGQPDAAVIYAFGPDGMTRRSVEGPVSMPEKPQGLSAGREVTLGGISVALRESINDPPRIVAFDGRREVSLTAPDETLQGVWFARTVPFEWQEPDGKKVTGGLTLPRGFTKGRPVPLVIQGYSYWPEAWLPDGHTKMPSAARQALAARGIAVLEMDNPSMSADAAYRRRYVERIDAAVEALANAGIVDPARVGVTGFSHGGYLAYYAITHPGRTRLAAAICADSWRGDYARYLQSGAFGGAWGAALSTFEFVNSGSEEAYRSWRRLPRMTFWDGKAQWLEHETSFNVDRVQTPALFTLHGGLQPPGAYLSEFETIGAFMLNRKPVEYLYFPEADHQMERPRERLAMMNVTVDWMMFWLKDYEDPSPHKAKQYARWRPMRELQEQAAAARVSAR